MLYRRCLSAFIPTSSSVMSRRCLQDLRSYFPRSIRCRALCNTAQSNAPEENLKNEPSGHVVYISSINKTVKLVKLFSFSTSIAAMIIQPLMLHKHWAMMHDPLTFASVGLTSIVCLGMFLTPFLLHFLIKRHVHSILFDSRSQVFTAVTYSLLMRHVHTRFTTDEVVELASPKADGSPLQFGTIAVRGKPLLFDLSPQSFADQTAFQLLVDACRGTSEEAYVRQQMQSRSNRRDS